MKTNHKQKISRHPVTLQYLLSMLVLLTVVLGGVRLYHSVTMDGIRKSASDSVSMLSDILFENISAGLEMLDNTATAIAYSSQVRSFLTQENKARRYDKDVNVYSMIKILQEKNPNVRTIVLYDTYGSIYQYGISYANETCRALYRQFITKHTPCFSVTQAEGNEYFTYCIPIYSAQLGRTEHLGMVLLFAPSQLVSTYLNEYAVENSMTFLLTDSTGSILSASDKALINEQLSGALMNQFSENVIKSKQLTLFGLTITVAQDASYLSSYMYAYYRMTLILMTALSISFVYISLIFRKRQLKPIDQVIASIDRIGDGHPEERIPQTINDKINEMVDDLNQLLDSLNRANNEAMEKQRILYDAQLNRRKHQLYMLRKQIDVHFTYNTLSTIASLAHERKQEDICHMAEGMGTLLRSAFIKSEYINIFQGFQNLEEYVYIMNMRYVNRFDVQYDVDDRLCRLRMPRQLLQPLVENAMIHGREQDDLPIRIWVCGRLENSFVHLTIADDGQGIAPDKLEKIRASLAEHKEEADSSDQLEQTHSVSLMNINRRLHMSYGESATLLICAREGGGTLVSLSFPQEEDPECE